MVSFKTKKIAAPDTLGEILKNRRQEMGLRLDKISREIKISLRYLEALEEGRYEKLPGEVYVKNFLKTYGIFLNLNLAVLLEIYKKEKNINSKTKRYSSKENQSKLSFFHFMITPRIIRFAGLILLVLVCLGYLGWEIRKIITPPFLFVSSPLGNLATKEGIIEVRGQTDKEAAVAINGEEILVNEQGYFKKRVDLKKGLNVIKVSAAKKYSRKNIILRNILAEE